MPNVAVEEARRFIQDCFRAAGIPDEAAREQASLLLQADLFGHFSHGLNRLELYIKDIESGSTDPAAIPQVLKETPGTAWVDGCNGLGAPVAKFSMDLAIKKAKEVGVGWVATKRCNHFGMAAYWAQMARDQGLIGMAFTNSSPLLVPTRATVGACGTNPIGMVAPAVGDDSLYVDMASTAVALGKIEVQIRKGQPIPESWALGPDGKPTSDAQTAFSTRKLMPLGGTEENCGYKGYCLSAMVEAFVSGLTGAEVTHKVRGWSFAEHGTPPNLGQSFVAINPECFAPGFAERISECLNHYRGLEPADPSLPVLAPGDKERMHCQQTMGRGSIEYVQQQIQTCNALAKKLKVNPIKVL